MLQRGQSAVVIVVVVGAAFVLAPGGIVALCVVLAGLAGREVERLLAASGRTVVPWAVALGAVLIVLAAGSVALGFPNGVAIVSSPWAWAPVPAIVAIGIGLGALRSTDPARAFGAWEATAFGALYIGMLAFVLALLDVRLPSSPADVAVQAIAPIYVFRQGVVVLDVSGVLSGSGSSWLLALVAAVWSFDTGAYLVGRAFGRRPFFAHVSPSKTLEGFLGGVVVATGVVVLALAWLGRPTLDGVILGPLLAIAAQAGDLAESTLKRAAGAKDSGSLIPGHGGVLAAYLVLVGA